MDTLEQELEKVRSTFFSEGSELLEQMEAALLELESSPEDQDTINSLFRSAHTIKGSAGIVGIECVEKFTHGVENLLSKVRDRVIGVAPDIIELLLECRDHISALIAHEASGGGDIPGDVKAREQGLAARLGAFLDGEQKEPAGKGEPGGEKAAVQEKAGDEANTDAWHISIRFGPDVLRCGMDPVSFMSYLSKLGEIKSMATLLDSMPPAPEMDPEACYIGLEFDFMSDFDKKAIEDVFEFVREDSSIHILPPHSNVATYIELITNLPEDTLLLGELLVKGGALTQAELDEALMLQNQGGHEGDGAQADKRPLGGILLDEGMVHPEVVDAALDKQKKNQAAKAKENSTIRIDAQKLDVLINLVGELVIANANLEQHVNRIKDGGLVESASIFSRLVEEVRDNTMRVRMVPIGETFSRFNRVVRDIGREFGKEIELVTSGGDTELDKTVVEKINDPLMHLVRNAADHGIETAEARIAGGKPARGTIRLNAFHDAGCIVIEVSDDGKGLSRSRILEKALDQGMISMTQTLSDSDVFSLIFEPGFSTAEKVTRLSGRGVGMDVVKRNIESLRGTVEVKSAEGAGTTVRIRLPLTLAIIDGFLVGVGDSSYVIPLEMVMECVELSEADRESSGKRNYMNLRGEVLPYIRLRKYFNEEGRGSSYENIVIVQYGGQKTGLVVDELFGEVQAVIKSLGKVYRDIKGISGATIMGNGKVALILDVPSLVQSAEQESVTI